jgi:sulfur transfer protein SufE
VREMTHEGDTWRRIIDLLNSLPDIPDTSYNYAKELANLLWIHVTYQVGPVTLFLTEFDAGFVSGAVWSSMEEADGKVY